MEIPGVGRHLERQEEGRKKREEVKVIGEVQDKVTLDRRESPNSNRVRVITNKYTFTFRKEMGRPGQCSRQKSQHVSQ